jgi:hypothetical protein
VAPHLRFLGVSFGVSMSISRTISRSQTISSPECFSAQAISLHIPYLRRFSRVLTGSQPGGDAYVLAALALAYRQWM